MLLLEGRQQGHPFCTFQFKVYSAHNSNAILNLMLPTSHQHDLCPCFFFRGHTLNMTTIFKAFADSLPHETNWNQFLTSAPTISHPPLPQGCNRTYCMTQQSMADILTPSTRVLRHFYLCNVILTKNSLKKKQQACR